MPTIEAVLSQSRLRRYPGAGITDRLQVYRWNIALAEALYPTMHFFEVALRNRMHDALTDHVGTEWWFQDPNLVSHPYATKAVAEALDKIKGRPPVAGDVVAGVSFGFWRGFYLKQYESLWRSILRGVYPYIPNHQAKRSILNTRVERFRRLRNRVAHHEPVFHWRDLRQQHPDICETLSWLSPAARTELVQVDRFTTVLAEDPRQ